MISGAGLNQPGQLKTAQAIQRHLGTKVIEHQEMAGGKLGFERPERAVIPRIKARTAEVVVMLRSNTTRHLIGAPGWPSAFLIRVARLRTHGRKGTFGQVRKNRGDEFSIRNLKNTAFAAFTGFDGVGQQNCRCALRHGDLQPLGSSAGDRAPFPADRARPRLRRGLGDRVRERPFRVRR